MSKYFEILESLKKVYKINGFSLGLHTTNIESAKSILKTGLEERSGRTLEGTVKLFGDVKKDVEVSDLDWFFPYTDSTVLVGIPSIFKVERDIDSESGNKHTCDFSLFIDMASNGQMGKRSKEIFNKNGHMTIPSELIIGYYDKNGVVNVNENCVFFEKDSKFLKELESIWKDEKNRAFFDFYKSMSKDKLNYGQSNANNFE